MRALLCPAGPSLIYRQAMEFSRDELLWINNALAEVLGGPEAIEAWEFQSRIGGDRDEVRALLQKVNDEVSDRGAGACGAGA